MPRKAERLVMSEAHRQAISRALRSSPKRIGRPPVPLVHGTVTGYANRRCRCDGCREAWRVYRKDIRERDRKRAA
jgi:hypothetical protein